MENCIEKLLDEIHTYNITNPGFSEASERVQDYDDLCVALYDRVYGEGYLEYYPDIGGEYEQLQHENN